jgi:quercetin dioxygenase-like cupin family protein
MSTASTAEMPSARSPSAGTTWASPLGLAFAFLIDGQETNGQFSLIHVTAKRGAGPARHVHSREDEAFYLLSGDVRTMVGEAVTTLRPGDAVFLPRGVPHTYQVISEEAVFLNVIAPAGFDAFFREVSEAPDRGENAGVGMTTDRQRIAALLNGYGVAVVGPPLPVA